MTEIPVWSDRMKPSNPAQHPESSTRPRSLRVENTSPAVETSGQHAATSQAIAATTPAVAAIWSTALCAVSTVTEAQHRPPAGGNLSVSCVKRSGPKPNSGRTVYAAECAHPDRRPVCEIAAEPRDPPALCCTGCAGPPSRQRR